MARIKFTLLKADQSPHLSYSRTSLKTLPVLQRRIQHVSLCSCRPRGARGVEEEGKEEEKEWWGRGGRQHWFGFLQLKSLREFGILHCLQTSNVRFYAAEHAFTSWSAVQDLSYTIQVSIWSIKIQSCYVFLEQLGFFIMFSFCWFEKLIVSSDCSFTSASSEVGVKMSIRAETWG